MNGGIINAVVGFFGAVSDSAKTMNQLWANAALGATTDKNITDFTPFIATGIIVLIVIITLIYKIITVKR